jgi:hypothetical protein
MMMADTGTNMGGTVLPGLHMQLVPHELFKKLLS